MKRTTLQTCLTIAYKNLEKHPEKDHHLHFSFVIVGEKVVEWGTNRTGGPLRHLGYPEYTKVHSEVDAWTRAYRKGFLPRETLWSLVNIRLTKTGDVGLSAPCPCCLQFLTRLGCHKVAYTTEEKTFQVRGL